MPARAPTDAFPLDTDACELLIAFEETGTVSRLAERRRRDISVVSRQLQALAEAAPVLAKHRGKWVLTPLGRRFAQWTREALASQKRLLHQKTRLRLVATREFASRVLAPNLVALLGPELSHVVPELVCADEGVEATLLSGNADLGFDCGRPVSPAVRFRRVRHEPFTVVASPAFLKQHRARSLEALLDCPHLHYARLAPARALGLDRELPHASGLFNDIATARAACVAGLGWTVLPTYTIRDELRDGRLRPIGAPRIESERYGVWWLEGSPLAQPWIARAMAWLRDQDLG